MYIAGIPTIFLLFVGIHLIFIRSAAAEIEAKSFNTMQRVKWKSERKEKVLMTSSDLRISFECEHTVLFLVVLLSQVSIARCSLSAANKNTIIFINHQSKE